MNLIPLNSKIVLTLFWSIWGSSTFAAVQQWQSGHQPQGYVVPQYQPRQPRQFTPSQPLTAPQNLHSSSEFFNYPLENPTDQTPEKTNGNSLLEPAPIRQETVEQAYPLTTDKTALPTGQSLTNSPSHGSPLSSQVANQQQPRFGLDYTMHRDLNRYPVDPRKPCNECTHPTTHDLLTKNWPGKNGQPYQDLEPGACQCSKASCKSKGNFSVNWPAPFSSIRESHHPTSGSHCPDERPRINDRFNHLASFKLVQYQRSDSGYCGPGADPYGCLGESRSTMR